MHRRTLFSLITCIFQGENGLEDVKTRDTALASDFFRLGATVHFHACHVIVHPASAISVKIHD